MLVNYRAFCAFRLFIWQRVEPLVLFGGLHMLWGTLAVFILLALRSQCLEFVVVDPHQFRSFLVFASSKHGHLALPILLRLPIGPEL